MDQKIKVLVVDDHEMVRIGVVSYLSIQPNIEVVGQASDGQEGVEKAKKLQPDVILMDLVMAPVDGVEATKRILAEMPNVKIIIVTSFIDDEKVFPAIDAGAYGYLLKTSSAQNILEGIEKVSKGIKMFEPQVLQKINNPENHMHLELTSREMEVLLLISKGLSNQEISEQLFISLKTVKTHVSNILEKLNVEDRTQATIYAFKKGLVK